MAANLHQSRHYSQFLSLQLKARLQDIPTPYMASRKCTIFADRSNRFLERKGP